LASPRGKKKKKRNRREERDRERERERERERKHDRIEQNQIPAVTDKITAANSGQQFCVHGD
jgi:Ni/Co efflux regulator RcnB